MRSHPAVGAAPTMLCGAPARAAAAAAAAAPPPRPAAAPRRAARLPFACRAAASDAGTAASPSAARPAGGPTAAAAGAASPASPFAAAAGALPKNFDPAAEEAIYAWWEAQGLFQPISEEAAAAAGGHPPFCVAMPPPNVTGRLHMGHAMFVALQDIMVRVARARGRPTLWLPGTDHAGIATQMVVERALAARGRSRAELGREAFEAEVWAWKAQYGGFITSQLRRLGASCDWGRERFTLDAGLSAAVAEAFERLHARGLVYRGAALVNWAPGLRTAVSDLEVEYAEEPGHMYHFEYPVADSDERVPVATTRPETIPGDTALAVHPDDPRYAHLVGRAAVVPLSGGRRIPIVADAYVDREFGTGALKVTPGHDPADWELGQRHGLEVINLMDDAGCFTPAAGAALAGLPAREARAAVWAGLEAEGLALRREPHTLRVPRAQRGGEVVEPLVREQWFVRMAPLAAPALAAAADGRLAIVPERFGKTYARWLEGIRDWCVSRQLWWGHRIPVWYAHGSEAEADAAPGGRGARYVVARDEAAARAKAAAEFGPAAAVALRQEPDVLDTWFSSALWPFSTLGWPDEGAPDLARFYPTAVMETGHDILFFWVARMVMLGLEFTGQLPFRTVYLHGLVRDERGRKMSKSLGNVVDPVEAAAEYGADALRLALATGTAPGQDLALSMDRVLAARNFGNKLWNAGRFVIAALGGGGGGGEGSGDGAAAAEEGGGGAAAAGAGAAAGGGAAYAAYAGVDLSTAAAQAAAGLSLPDRWVVGALHACVDASTAAHARLDFGEAGRLLQEFAWSDFADWYIEAAKARLYGGDAAAAAATRATLAYVMDRLLRLAHPFMPFVTEELWQALPAAAAARAAGGPPPALIAAAWPAEGGARDGAAEAAFGALQAAVRAVRNARAEYGVEPGRRVAAAVRAADPALRAALAEEAAALALLARLDPDQLAFEDVGGAAGGAGAGGGTIELVVREGLEVALPLAGLFDAAKEVERLGRQAAKAQKELDGLRARLGNAAFAAKAPADVVAEARAQVAELEEQLAAIADKVARFQQLV